MQRRIDYVLRDLPFVKKYLDDLFIASRNHQEHLQHLRQLLLALREANLKVNRDKCTFGKPQVLYLGYLVSKDGFQPPPNKVEAIQQYPRPTTTTELRSFLGIINYYRRCIPKAAELQAPLNNLLKGIKKKHARLTWTEEAEQAFQRCKDSITEAVCTTFLDPMAPLALRTDASSISIGADLEQQQPDGTWRPLGFFSQKLNPAQVGYATFDRELLAIYAAIKHFERILEGQEFNVYTDHRPLSFAFHQPSYKASPR